MTPSSESDLGQQAHLDSPAKPSTAQTIKSPRTSDMNQVPSYLQLKRLLVPIDFSDFSEKAFRYGMRFAEQFGAELLLLHVVQPVVYPADFGFPPTRLESLDEEFKSQATEKLQEFARMGSKQVQAIVRTGQPYMEITAAAKDLDVDLIIITTHGHTGLKHVLLGSTAERVVRHAPCPVLTLRDREHEFA